MLAALCLCDCHTHSELLNSRDARRPTPPSNSELDQPRLGQPRASSTEAQRVSSQAGHTLRSVAATSTGALWTVDPWEHRALSRTRLCLSPKRVALPRRPDHAERAATG